MGKSQRDKGKRGERMLAAELREAFPELADGIRRGWQSRAGDDDPDIVGLPGFWLESKHGRMPNPRAALKQALSDADGTSNIPIAVIRDDRKEPFAVLRWSDMLRILKAYMNRSEP